MRRVGAYPVRVAAKSRQLQIRVTPAEKAALKRAAHRAGLEVSQYVLSRLLPPARTRLLDVIAALRRAEPQRLALADLNDLLAGLAPPQFSEAVADVDLTGLTPFAANYVAAMVEQAAHQKGEAAPPWTRDVEPPDIPYFAVPFARLRPHLLRDAPVAFKRRNLFVDATIGDRV
jgi:uncharacterized protein (DUF1778 family)